MIRIRFAAATAALLLAATAARAHAQMPADNDAWKARCSALSTMAPDLGHVTPQVAALTRGVAASKFQTFAFERQAANQHNVACTLFYLAAVANAQSDKSAAEDSLLMANLEVKGMKGQQPTFGESITRVKVKAFEIRRPSLTLDDEEKVVAAATTIPFATTAMNNARPVTYNTSKPASIKR